MYVPVFYKRDRDKLIFMSLCVLLWLSLTNAFLDIKEDLAGRKNFAIERARLENVNI